MSESAVTIIVTVVSALGAGGLGAAIITAITHRKVRDAEATMTLAEGYEKRLARLTERACQLEARIETLEGLVSTLRDSLSERETMIDKLQSENAELRLQVDKLTAESACKERKIVALQTRMRHLEKLIKDMGLNINDGEADS